ANWILNHPDTLRLDRTDLESVGLPPMLQNVLSQNGSGGIFDTVTLVPLIMRDESLGIICIQSYRPDVFDPDDFHLLEPLANYVAMAIANLRLLDDLERLQKIGQSINEPHGSDNLLDYIAALIRDGSEADLVVVYPFDQLTNALDPEPS